MAGFEHGYYEFRDITVKELTNMPHRKKTVRKVSLKHMWR